jgi:hypothetical protein
MGSGDVCLTVMSRYTLRTDDDTLSPRARSERDLALDRTATLDALARAVRTTLARLARY